MTTMLIKTCRCGLNMKPTKPGSQHGVCVNCDALQPQELEGKPRVRTMHDRRFHLAWERIKRAIYTR